MSTEIDVRSLRESIGWNQERLAQYLGIDRSSVSHMERGRRIRGPYIRLLENLRRAAEAGAADELFPEAAE